MTQSFTVRMSVEETRDRFYEELVQRGPGSVGLETNIAGHVDARRRFALAIQGWEKNQWIRPFLTRLEGHFERSEDDLTTRVVFVRRGLWLPLTFISLLFPYWAINVIPDWPPPHITWTLLLGVAILIVPLVGGVFFWLESRVHTLLLKALLASYEQPPLD